MSMKYINRKNKAEEDVLGDGVLLSFIESLAKKYPLRTTNYKGFFVSEIVKEDDYVEVTLSRYTSEDAPIREIEDSCWFNDYDFTSLNLYEEDIVNIKADFRKFMISKFGEEYEKDLKAYLRKQRDNEIEEAIKEITEKYDMEWFLLQEDELEK